MKTVIKQVPATSIMFAPNVSLMDCQRVIQQNMNLDTVMDYAMALDKIQRNKPLRRSDLELFDKVDEITTKHLGITLKDSKVTRARLNACKHFGIEFEDRGGLINHMNLVEAAKQKTSH